jgi:hypothetical protein
MADARAETPESDEGMELDSSEGMGRENDMDLSPRSCGHGGAMRSVQSSPVQGSDANCEPVPVSDSAAGGSNPYPGHLPDGTGRLRAHAGIPPMHPPAVLAKLSNLSLASAAGFVGEVRDRYVVAPGQQAEGIECRELRAGMKRAASHISRSQYEIYNFSTRHSLSEAATDELLMLVGNVSVLFSLSRSLLFYFVSGLSCSNNAAGESDKNQIQVRFSPEGITHKTMKSMDKAARTAMLPNYQIYCADLREGVHYLRTSGYSQSVICAPLCYI